MKIAIAMPNAGTVQSLTALCLASLTLYVASTDGPPLLIAPTGRIEQNRNMAVEVALKANCDYLMFVDADMTFPMDTVARLIAHKVDIVGCNAAGRVSGKPVFDYSGAGLLKVPAIGMAVTLIKTSVFWEMNAPWYVSPPRSWAASDLISSDINFCNMAGNQDYKIYCDLDLSKEIGHLSTINRVLS
jgi:hypothetical protein